MMADCLDAGTAVVDWRRDGDREGDRGGRSGLINHGRGEAELYDEEGRFGKADSGLTGSDENRPESGIEMHWRAS